MRFSLVYLCIIALFGCVSNDPAISVRNTPPNNHTKTKTQQQKTEEIKTAPSVVPNKKTEAEIPHQKKFFPRLDVMITKNNPVEILREFSRLTQNASVSDIQEAIIRITPILEHLQVEVVSAPGIAQLGKTIDSPCSIKITFDTGEEKIPLVGLPCVVAQMPSYALKDERTFSITQTLTSDKNGIVQFYPDRTYKAINSTIVMGPEFFAYSLSRNNSHLREYDADFIDVFTPFMKQFLYRAETNEKTISTEIVLLDFDEDNMPLFKSKLTSARLHAGLIRKGFRNIHIASNTQILNHSDETLVKSYANTNIQAERILFIRVYVEKLSLNEKYWECDVSADLAVFNNKQKRIVARLYVPFHSKGKTKAQALAAARAGMGGVALVDALRFGIP